MLRRWRPCLRRGRRAAIWPFWGSRREIPPPYGRLVIEADGTLSKIVEAKDAGPEEFRITACNSGVMAASAPRLFSLLSKVTNQNAKGEYYLTDVVGLARAEGLKPPSLSRRRPG